MKDITITDIQHFSVGDGPGIRTTVFFKGCNLHCPWCHNPETISFDINLLYGRRCTISEVFKEIVEDAAFYKESGGGVTISGGEPLMQAEGCSELAKSCKEHGIHVLLDTAGNVEWQTFEKVLSYIDMCYFDLKSGTEQGYSMVGGQLERTLCNMKAVIESGVLTVARIPIIPGFNDSILDAENMIEALSHTGITQVNLLPFHRLGSNKYEALGMKYTYAMTPTMKDEHLEPILSAFRCAGFEVSKGG